VVRLLRGFNNFIGVDECAQGVGGLFSVLKYSIGWVSSFLSQKVSKPWFQNLSG
jgi:hypothetical protein